MAAIVGNHFKTGQGALDLCFNLSSHNRLTVPQEMGDVACTFIGKTGGSQDIIDCTLVAVVDFFLGRAEY